tara:strand:+ start:230 stop:382 length:153 start_codon:yes stop_codon:yes gene_type:complete
VVLGLGSFISLLSEPMFRWFVVACVLFNIVRDMFLEVAGLVVVLAPESWV